MNTIPLNDLYFQKLCARFCSFFDAVVDQVSVRYTPEKKVSIILIVKDNQSESGWAKVVFEMLDFDEFKFVYGRHTFEVLSSGMQVFWQQGAVHLYLDAYPDDAGPPNRDSNLAYVVGKALYYRELLPADAKQG